MVKLQMLLPDDRDIGLLRCLASPTSVLKSRDQILRTVMLFVADKDGKAVELIVEYRDVVFKFEIFGLFPRAGAITDRCDLEEIARFANWDRIVCLCAFEWERPALEGETPPNWEPIVRRRGVRSDIPANATAIGVSLVGIAFFDAVRYLPVGMIYTDDADPSALHVSGDVEEISGFMADCERVAIESFPEWKRNLLIWRESLEAAA